MTDQQADNPGLVMIPPLYPLLVLAAAIVLEFLVPLGFLPAPAWLGWLTLAGVLALAIAVWLIGSAIRTFEAAGTNVEPYKPSLKIVTDGPFRFTRNPIYLGFLLAYLGLCLNFALEWGVLLLPVLWLALDRMVVVKEEAYLTRKFGEQYTSYLGRTRRWI